jgi:1-deoxy-D-xylulose-5-phosphate reductoisomerase
MTHSASARKIDAARAPRKVTILGSTGSVGTQTVDLLLRDPDAYQVMTLTARKNVALLAQQARQLNAQNVVIADESQYAALKDALADTKISVAAGAKAVAEAAEDESEWVMAAIVGAAGLPGTLAAARKGKMVAFANKETLVCAGPLMMKLVESANATLLPVDSEHNAIWQVFDFDHPENIRRIIVTASGGPFRTKTREEMATMTAADAVKHPVWAMGAKISVDSATLMNKTLEVIEAAFLFRMPSEKIDVLVHPQSVIHSMVDYVDGSVLAQLGTPDMRTPISTTLAYPNRMPTPATQLDFVKLGQLTFEAPDPVKFPALRMGREALKLGGTAPALMNAANEIAVQAFLDGKIGFLDIERIIEATLTHGPVTPLTDLDTLLAVDAEARRFAAEQVK